MRQHSLRNRRNAFTLVELLIVIIIIAVLAAIAIPKFSNSTTRGKEAALKSNLKLLRNAVELFKNDTGLYPATLADLAVTAAPAQGYNSATTPALTNIAAADWRGPYIQTLPSDIDGGTFTYTVTTLANQGQVKSSVTNYSGY